MKRKSTLQCDINLRQVVKLHIDARGSATLNQLFTVATWNTCGPETKGPKSLIIVLRHLTDDERAGFWNCLVSPQSHLNSSQQHQRARTKIMWQQSVVPGVYPGLANSSQDLLSQKQLLFCSGRAGRWQDFILQQLCVFLRPGSKLV
ncbi:hypothetical protein PGT21_020937 [Puccinia graminis f. sp. tritici]|uniref:Uncharacterized protein n=1 Tax=Puccinia graminis f. sp. tritici TaxID=56615 RepID=A0A5B0Q2W1_PUCGR|nr:hypothetical protein PGT21_020937 [Puccinia graminis f. sp. tritici]